MRLGAAVEQARIAAGYLTRQEFAAAAGVGLRSLIYLEQANRSVGTKVLSPVARALPGWTEDTIREILEGGDPPSVAQPPVVEPAIPEFSPTIGDLPDYSDKSPDERRRIIRRSIDQLPYSLDVSQAAYDATREDLIRLIVAYEPREGEQ